MAARVAAARVRRLAGALDVDAGLAFFGCKQQVSLVATCTLPSNTAKLPLRILPPRLALHAAMLITKNRIAVTKRRWLHQQQHQ